MIDTIKQFNREFVASEGYRPYVTSKYPDKKIAVVTCMDTRLVELLPAALGIKNGDVKMIKNAGGMIRDPYGEAMRSLLVAIYELGVNEIMVIGHTDCGVKGLNAEEMKHLMEQRGISPRAIAWVEKEGVDLERWLGGFDEDEESVRRSVHIVKAHPFIPADVHVGGYIIDTTTGELTEVAQD